MSKKQQKQKNLKIALVAIFLAIVLALVAALAYVTNLFCVWQKPELPDTEQVEPLPDDKKDDENGGAIVTPGEGEREPDDKGDKDGVHAVAMNVVKIAAEDFPLYGISPLAESAFQVTATVEGKCITEGQKTVTWNHGWASDNGAENVSDYVKLTSKGNTATLECLKEFGVQIIVTATSTLNTAKTGTCTVDYKEKIEFAGLTYVGFEDKSLEECNDVLERIEIPYKVTSGHDLYFIAKFNRSEQYTIKGDEIDINFAITFRPDEVLNSRHNDILDCAFNDNDFTFSINSKNCKYNGVINMLQRHEEAFPFDGKDLPFESNEMNQAYFQLMEECGSTSYIFRILLEGEEYAPLYFSFDEFNAWKAEWIASTVSVSLSESGFVF